MDRSNRRRQPPCCPSAAGSHRSSNRISKNPGSQPRTLDRSSARGKETPAGPAGEDLPHAPFLADMSPTSITACSKRAGVAAFLALPAGQTLAARKKPAHSAFLRNDAASSAAVLRRPGRTFARAETSIHNKYTALCGKMGPENEKSTRGRTAAFAPPRPIAGILQDLCRIVKVRLQKNARVHTMMNAGTSGSCFPCRGAPAPSGMRAAASRLFGRGEKHWQKL